MAVRASDDGIFISTSHILIISDGLETVMFKIILSAENLESIENMIFNHPVVKSVGIVESVACDPCGMRENCKSARFPDLIIQPFDSCGGQRINVIGYINILCKLGHFCGKFLFCHNVRAFPVKRTKFFILADFLNRLILDKRIYAVFAAEVDRVRINVKAVDRRKMNFLAGYQIELGRNILEALHRIKRRIIAFMIGHCKEIVAVRTVACRNIFGIVCAVGIVRVHMKVAHKRIYSDKVTLNGIDGKGQLSFFLFEADSVLAL